MAIYDTTVLTEVVNQLKPVNLYLWNLLIKIEKAHAAKDLEVHTKYGKREIVPLVGRRENGTFLKESAFEKRVYTPQMLKPYVIAEAASLLTQQFGQTQYDSPVKLAKKRELEEVTRLKEVAARTKQYHLSKILFTGILPSNEGNEGIDFGIRKYVMTGESLWTNPNADIIGALKNIRKEIQKETGRVPDTLIVSTEVGSAIENNAKIIEKLRVTSGDLINMDTKQLDEGVSYIGYIPEINTRILSYTEFVDTDEAEGVELIPTKSAAYIQKNSFRCDYAAITAKMKPGQQAQIFVKKEIIRKREDGDDDLLELLTSPLIKPEIPKSWAVIEAI